MKNLITLIVLVLLSCNNSKETKIDKEFSKPKFKKVETNNSLELTYQILNEYDEEIDFSNLKTIAEFPGGFDSLAVFVKKNYVYPKYINKDTIKGRVEVFFSIDTIGKVIDIELKKGIYKDIDKSCLNVISKFPNWKPAKIKNGKKAKMRFMLPLVFVGENK